MRRVLVSGWFSFEKMGSTAGDIIARDLVCKWLEKAGLEYDIALAAPFEGGISWEKTNPGEYTDVVFVCGPFGNGWPVTEFLQHFLGCRFSGVNLTMLQSPEEWNPFEILFERDSNRAARPDITFLAPPPKVPVVGVILAHKQLEYGNHSLHEKANEVIRNLISEREASVVMIDTSLENNQGGLRTHGEIESLIAKMDMVITTRLHGTVLALKNGVPVIPIDPIEGGAKISIQVKTLGWPLLFNYGNMYRADLLNAFDFCLTENARNLARECAQSAIERVKQIREGFIELVLNNSEMPVINDQD
jgi:Polysaccharide pyruvyl transferase